MNNLQKCLVTTVLKNILDEILIINKGRYKILKIQDEKKSINERFKNKVHESSLRQLNPFEKTIECLEDIKLQEDM